MKRDGIKYFDHGNETAQKTAKIQLEMILSNKHHLIKVRNGAKYFNTASQLNELLKRGIKLTPNQLSLVDGIYERIWKGAGFESCDLHVDKKKKGLRF